MNNGEENARCSFCDEEYSSSSIGEHLMLCGNKTDQCPNCRKYIRRAVFAYHYENDCANLDETEDKPSDVTKKPDTSSAGLFITPMDSVARNQSSLTMPAANFPTTSQPQASSSRPSTSGYF